MLGVENRTFSQFVHSKSIQNTNILITLGNTTPENIKDLSAQMLTITSKVVYFSILGHTNALYYDGSYTLLHLLLY